MNRSVWKRMLDSNPFAVLTPWRKGSHTLPSQHDVRRILSFTTNAYASARIGFVRTSSCEQNQDG